jgi:hypothetical protein
MKILDKILECRRAPYIIAGIIFFCSLGVLSCFKSAEKQLTELNQAVLFSRILVKSSDDLTNYARYFVTTKNESWRTEFNTVLKIRNGELPSNDGIDDGIKKSFKDRLKDIPFSSDELDILLHAEQLSNNLAKIEVKAFEWIDKGKSELNFDVQMHHYTAAEMLMFGNDYNKQKNEIIDTIRTFYTKVIDRLRSQYIFYMSAAWTLITVINVSLLLLVMIIKHKDTATPRRTAVKKAVPKPRVKKPPQ